MVFYFAFYADYSPICNSLYLCYVLFIDTIWKKGGGYFAYTDRDYKDEFSLDFRIIYDFIYGIMIVKLTRPLLAGKFYIIK
jgi:hypothetical protein